jgi:hypothetical protein
MLLEIGLNNYQKLLFIIESPFQLLGALEAIDFFKTYEYQLVIRLSEERNNRQLKKIIHDLDVDQTHIKYINFDSKKNLKNFYRTIKFTLWLQAKKHIFTKIYLGDYHSQFLTFIRTYTLPKEKIYYLDDGVASLNIQKSFIENKYYHLFTMYDLKPLEKQQIIQHHFSYLKGVLNRLDLESEDIVLLLGNKFYEEGLVSKSYFFQSLKQVLSYYVGKNIRYVAHRDEDKKKLAYLHKHYGFDVIQNDYPIELYGFYERKIPSTIVSFLSTALLTMKIIYEDVTVTAYRIDYNELLDRKEGFRNIYAVYEKYLEVKEL